MLLMVGNRGTNMEENTLWSKPGASPERKKSARKNNCESTSIERKKSIADAYVTPYQQANTKNINRVSIFSTTSARDFRVQSFSSA